MVIGGSFFKVYLNYIGIGYGYEKKIITFFKNVLER